LDDAKYILTGQWKIFQVSHSTFGIEVSYFSFMVVSHSSLVQSSCAV